jgi:hypothetical protein
VLRKAGIRVEHQNGVYRIYQCHASSEKQLVNVGKRRVNPTRKTRNITGKTTISAGGIPFPLEPRFAIADIARIAIEDAVSKPDCESVLVPRYRFHMVLLRPKSSPTGYI